MNWSDLRLLLALHEEGTLQGVSTAHGINASTVSRRLRLLEDQVGTQLVENVSGRLALTTAGERAIRAAEEMKRHSDDLLREISGRQSELSGTVRVGLLEVQIRYHADIFSTFAKLHPAVEVQLLSHGQRLHSLNQREVDLVLRATERPDDTLVGRQVQSLEFAVFAHPDLVEGTFDPQRVPWLGPHGTAANALVEWMHRHTSPESIRIRVNSIVATLDLARAGVGACIAPTIYGRKAGLRQLTGPIADFHLPVWLLTHRDLVTNARVRALSEHMFVQMRKDASETASLGV